MLTVSIVRQACSTLGWTALGTWPALVTGVGTDTRSDLSDHLFVALVGERFDGHNFVDAAVDAGASVLLVHRLRAAHLARRYPELLVVGVEDTLYAMGELARLSLAVEPRKVVAITGSAGKTSTRLAMVQAAEAAGYLVHTQVGNENNRIGVPRFILNLPVAASARELIVIECGTSEPGEIARLGALCRPDVAMVTSVCAAHTELLIDEAGVAHEKGDLLRSAYQGSGSAVFDPADNRLAQAAAQSGRKVMPLPDLTQAQGWGGAPAHLVANGAKVLAALSALEIAIDSKVIQAARLDPPPGRGGIVEIGSWRVMDDSYNANQASMVAALDSAAQAAGDDPLVVFLGEMRELGEHAERAHREVARHALFVGAKFLMFAGPYASLALAEAEGHEAIEVTVGADATDLTKQIEGLPRPAFILIKGSRGARMERILDALRERS